MQKVLLIFLTSALTISGFSQTNPRPSRSRFWNAKESTFNLKAGDILVYSVKDKGEEYDYIVTVNKYGNEIGFGYNVPAKKLKGNVSLTAIALTDGSTYQTDFSGQNKTTLWLSKSNFRDLATIDKR